MTKLRIQCLGNELQFDAVRRPASASLESLELCHQSIPTKRKDEIRRWTPTIGVASKLRSQSHIGTFDMSELEDASKKVESSIAFPLIEWPAFEGDVDPDPDDMVLIPKAKRPRFGLVRSAPSFNLQALESTERFDCNVDPC